MSHNDHTPHEPPAAKPVLGALIGEFHTPQELLKAAGTVYEAGYKKFDAHSPFPIHGIDEVMGIRMTRLPWITFFAACIGGVIAISMQYWMNVIDYPFQISGKPFFSVPASMPIVFELCVLFAAHTTIISMFLINGLPRFASPFTKALSTQRGTSDRYFVSIDPADPKFSVEGSRQLLESAGAHHVEACYVDANEWKFPKALVFGAIMLASLLLIPPVAIAKHRWVDKRIPKVHWIQDMDFQPKFKTQKVNKFFADGRASRPEVIGAVARGNFEDDDRLYKGLEDDDGRLQTMQTAFQESAKPAEAAPAAGGAVTPMKDPLDDLPWVKSSPIPVTAEILTRGQQRYNIHCSVCHGLAGDGDGLATLRALELVSPTWTKPVSFHTDNVRNQPIGRLFNSITHGVRKMPAMGDVVTVQDRWAILLYLRALQKTRTGQPSDVPEKLLPELKDLKLQ